jgi:hypothetical protein
MIKTAMDLSVQVTPVSKMVVDADGDRSISKEKK